MENKLMLTLFLVTSMLVSCTKNIHDDARKLADKKCRLIWTTAEYERVQAEFMGTMHQNPHRSADTSKVSTELNGVGRITKERELSARLESLSNDINELNKDIESLNEQYYRKYNEQEFSRLISDTKAIVSQCK